MITIVTVNTFFGEDNHIGQQSCSSHLGRLHRDNERGETHEESAKELYRMRGNAIERVFDDAKKKHGIAICNIYIYGKWEHPLTLFGMHEFKEIGYVAVMVVAFLWH